jgi:predicted HTH transcriptional regulator
MNREQYKSKRKGQPKRKGKLSKSKSRMLKAAQEWKPITSPQLREAYSTKIEWARKLIPKLKEEAEAS